MMRIGKTRFLEAIGLWVVVFFLCAAPSHAADTGAITDLAFLVDAPGTENIDSVSQPSRAHAFKAAPYGFSAGFTRSVHWLRFTLPAPAPDAQGRRETLLQIHPPYLDDLQVYLSQPHTDGAFEMRQAGDLQAHAAKEYPYRAFVFRVEFEDARPRTAYVRLQTTSSSVLTVKAWEPSRFLTQTAQEYALLGVLIGFFLAAMATNLWQSLWRQEAIYRRYIAYLLATLVNAMGVNGLAAEFLLPQSPFWAHHWVSLGTLSVVIFGTRFYVLALDIVHAPTWMRWVYHAQLWAAYLGVAAPFLDLYPEVAKFLLPFISLTLMTGTVRSVQLWRQKNSAGKFLLLAHLVSLVSTLSVVPTLMGIFPGQLWLIYGFQLGPIGTLLTLQLMLAQRVRTMQGQLNQAALDTKIATTTAQQERAEREQQRHFLSMLTHELKTPLSVIRLRLGAIHPTPRMQTHAKQAVNDIDAIVERCALVSQMDEKTSPLQRVPCHMDELLGELLSQQPSAHRVRLQRAADAVAICIPSDPLLLRTVLGNLIENALKYSPPGGTVQINLALGTQGGDRGVRIQIQNAAGAAGLPSLTHVFKKYYRAPGAYQQSGSGLGLYIVKALTERLGGTIECQSQDALVTFDLWLPQ